MTRIFSWLTATLVAVALITYYQANLSGEGERAHGPATAACGAPRTQATPEQANQADTPAQEDAEAGAAANEDKTSDPCASSDHSGKPGESK